MPFYEFWHPEPLTPLFSFHGVLSFTFMSPIWWWSFRPRVDKPTGYIQSAAYFCKLFNWNTAISIHIYIYVFRFFCSCYKDHMTTKPELLSGPLQKHCQTLFYVEFTTVSLPRDPRKWHSWSALRDERMIILTSLWAHCLRRSILDLLGQDMT